MPEPPAPGDSGKIMGLKKPLFWGIIVVGLIAAYWLYKRNQSSSYSATPSATDSVSYIDTSGTNGLTSADIGGTPSDTGTVYQPGDYTAQFDALTAQLTQSETDLSSEIASLSSAGIGPSVASAPNPPNVSVTVPIKVVKSAPARHRAKKRVKRHHK